MTEASQPDTDLMKMKQVESTYFGNYFIQVDQNRHMYNCEWDELIAIPGASKFMNIQPGTAARAIDDPADHILTMPRIKVPVREEDDLIEAQHAAEKKRLFLTAWWNQVEQLFDPIGGSAVMMLNEGRICWRRTLDFDALPEPYTKGDRKDRTRYQKAMRDLGKDHFLWEVELLDTKTVVNDPRDFRNPKWVYCHYSITVEEARDLFPDATGEWTKGDDLDKVEYTEKWTVDECKKWIEEEKVWDDDNPYGYIPILIEDAGFGTLRRGALPHEQFRGMTEKLFDVFVAQARQLTSWEIANELAVFPMAVARNMKANRRIRIEPGLVTPLAGGPEEANRESLEYLAMPAVPIGVLQLLQQTAQLANQYTKMDTLSGQPVAGVETATEASQQINNASAKIGKPISGFRRMCTRMNRLTLMDVDRNIEGVVTLYGTASGFGEITLGPDDIKGFYETTVELGTTDEDMVSQIKARFWGEMYRLIPFMSAQTAMERGGISEQPLEELLRRASEDVFLSPEMTMIRTLTGANAYGEFATLVRGNGWGPQGQQGGAQGQPGQGANSAEGLVSQETLASPMQAQTVNTAYANRDISQRVAELRAPATVRQAYRG